MIHLATAYVSIHAPAQGATKPLFQLRSMAQFQSTPPRRGRRDGMSIESRIVSFNPRPRAGGDSTLSGGSIQHVVSIHAPAQGATETFHIFDNQNKFQSTPPRRGRQT